MREGKVELSRGKPQRFQALRFLLRHPAAHQAAGQQHVHAPARSVKRRRCGIHRALPHKLTRHPVACGRALQKSSRFLGPLRLAVEDAEEGRYLGAVGVQQEQRLVLRLCTTTRQTGNCARVSRQQAGARRSEHLGPLKLLQPASFMPPRVCASEAVRNVGSSRAAVQRLSSTMSTVSATHKSRSCGRIMQRALGNAAKAYLSALKERRRRRQRRGDGKNRGEVQKWNWKSVVCIQNVKSLSLSRAPPRVPPPA